MIFSTDLGDIRTPYQTTSNTITLPSFKYPALGNSITLSYWLRMLSLDTADVIKLYSNTDSDYLLYFGYSNTGTVGFYTYCKSTTTYSSYVPKTATTDTWIQHTIALTFVATDTLNINYALDGGSYTNDTITCTQVDTQPTTQFYLFQSNAYFRDFKVFNYARRDYSDIKYLYRQWQVPSGEFILYYDFMDPPGSLMLRDLARPDQSLKFPATTKNALVWLPLYTVPVICKNGTVFDLNLMTCAGTLRCP